MVVDSHRQPNPDPSSLVMRHVGLLLSLLFLTGCVGNLHQLKERNPEANDFNSALASEYMAFADSESEQGHVMTANYYAGKGLDALNGHKVEPETVSSSLSEKSQGDLTAARTQLVALLTDDMKKVSPQKLARAQLLFDCWQHQVAANANQDLAPCAAEYSSSIGELQDVSDLLFSGKENTYTIEFPHKSTRLSDENKATIKEIAEHLKSGGKYSIQLKAYTGILAWQRKLSEARINVVHRELVRDGVQNGSIHVKKHKGSSKAVILSRDTQERNTKKVIIKIQMHNQVKEP